VAGLTTTDHQLTTQITAATKDIDALTFHEEPGIDDTIVGDKHKRVQAVDRHTFKDAPNPEPDPPPGGWSSDPLMRAAQKIAYGHAFIKHDAQFPGMTKDQLADLIHGKLKRSIENPEGLQLGVTKDGALIVYDPKDNVLIIPIQMVPTAAPYSNQTRDPITCVESPTVVSDLSSPASSPMGHFPHPPSRVLPRRRHPENVCRPNRRSRRRH
jgi:hypothetical protein